MNPEEAMRALMGTGVLQQGAGAAPMAKSSASFRDLSPADQQATEQAQLMPNFSRGYKVNPGAFNQWLNAGPWSENIEDRRGIPSELENAHMIEILKSMGATGPMLNKYKNQK